MSVDTIETKPESKQVPASSAPSSVAPGRIFTSLQREFDRVLEEFTHAFDPYGPARISPRMNVSELSDKVEVSVELPGLDRKDIKIEMAGDVLTVSGEKKDEREETGRDFRLIERSYGAFSRSIELPGADPAKIEACMDNGVLKITAPKSEVARSRAIEIKAG
jgi:HSP20 family protein